MFPDFIGFINHWIVFLRFERCQIRLVVAIMSQALDDKYQPVASSCFSLFFFSNRSSSAFTKLLQPLYFESLHL